MSTNFKFYVSQMTCVDGTVLYIDENGKKTNNIKKAKTFRSTPEINAKAQKDFDAKFGIIANLIGKIEYVEVQEPPINVDDTYEVILNDRGWRETYPVEFDNFDDAVKLAREEVAKTGGNDDNIMIMKKIYNRGGFLHHVYYYSPMKRLLGIDEIKKFYW